MDKKNLEDGCNCGHEHEHQHVHEDSCGCGCECGHDHSHEPMMVDLEDEEGNVVHCEVVDGFVFKDNEYAVVQHPEKDSVYLFKVVGDDETGELVIPDDVEFEEASNYYSSLE
jgi:uncharacterized protein YrzB (UPF0473 family)